MRWLEDFVFKIVVNIIKVTGWWIDRSNKNECINL